MCDQHRCRECGEPRTHKADCSLRVPGLSRVMMIDCAEGEACDHDLPPDIREKRAMAHGCDGEPVNGAVTRCGYTIKRGIVAFGPRWTYNQLAVVLKGSLGTIANGICPTCWPAPSPLTCPCCDREVSPELHARVVDEMAQAIIRKQGEA